AELAGTLVGVDWNFSQYIRDNVMEALSGVKGDNSVKIIGPALDELERIAERLKGVLDTIPGVENAGIFRIKGQPTLEFTVDRQKCKHWNVSVNDVENAIKIAVGGQAFTQMIEGEKMFDITLRWPEALRGSGQRAGPPRRPHRAARQPGEAGQRRGPGVHPADRPDRRRVQHGFEHDAPQLARECVPGGDQLLRERAAAAAAAPGHAGERPRR